ERDEMRADRIERGDEAAREHAAEQAAGRKRSADVGEVEQGKLRRDGKEEKDGADGLAGGRFDGLALEPAQGQQKDADGKQESGIASKLEEQVGHVSADRADPVAGRAGGWRGSGDVERS